MTNFDCLLQNSHSIWDFVIFLFLFSQCIELVVFLIAENEIERMQALNVLGKPVMANNPHPRILALTQPRK